MKRKRKFSITARTLERKPLIAAFRTRQAHAKSRGKNAQRRRDIRNARAA